MIKKLTVGIVLFIMVMNAMAQSKTFCIAKDGKTATIVVDEQDWKGVIRAANDLGDDVRKVCGIASEVKTVNCQLSIVHCPRHPAHAGHPARAWFAYRHSDRQSANADDRCPSWSRRYLL